MADLTHAVFLDRDGVINHNRADYIRVPEHFQYFETTPAAFGILARIDLPVVVVTNQSGIGRGYTTPEIVAELHDRLRRDAQRWGKPIDAIEICPHAPEEECVCRKPRPGMFQRVATDLGLRLEGSYMVGDSPSDMEAGDRLGMVTLRVETGWGEDPGGPEPSWRGADLLAAVRHIADLEGIAL